MKIFHVERIERVTNALKILARKDQSKALVETPGRLK
jgi:hypothetical protein